MYIVQTRGFSPVLNTTVAKSFVTANALTSNKLDASIIASWTPTAPGQPGYDTARKCYQWGYKPKPIQLIGLGALWSGEVFNICPPGTCPPPTMCPPPPPCARGPEGFGPAEEGTLGKYGVQIGVLAAVALTGGVGYYGYKKGWFKKGKKR